jgi:hypothetical protein
VRVEEYDGVTCEKVQGRYREGTGKVQGRYREGTGKVQVAMRVEEYDGVTYGGKVPAVISHPRRDHK